LLVKSNSFLLKSTFCPLKFPPLPVTSSDPMVFWC
jgi:hypothetical protein